MAGQMIRILDGNTFVVCDERGDIEALPSEPTGLFSFDTRFLSTWVLTINGQKLNPLSIDDLQYFESRFFLVPGTGTVYIDAKLSVIRQRAVGHGFHEELTILNHLDEPVDLDVRIDAGSDFADLFEIKDALKKLGTYATAVEDGRLRLAYERDTFRRETRHLGVGARPASTSSGLTFKVRLEPHEQLDHRSRGRDQRSPGPGGSYVRPKYGRGRKQARPNMERSLDRWIADAPTLESDWEPLRIDLSALPRRPRGACASRRPSPAARACRLPGCRGS